MILVLRLHRRLVVPAGRDDDVTGFRVGPRPSGLLLARHAPAPRPAGRPRTGGRDRRGPAEPLLKADAAYPHAPAPRDRAGMTAIECQGQAAGLLRLDLSDDLPQLFVADVLRAVLHPIGRDQSLIHSTGVFGIGDLGAVPRIVEVDDVARPRRCHQEILHGL